MRVTHAAAAFAALLAFTNGALAAAPEPSVAPLLSLDEAVQIAEEGNHLLASTARTVDEAQERTLALRTRRLPELRLNATGARLLTSLDFSIPAGAFGTLPTGGAIPPQESTVTVPAMYGAFATVSLAQPLTQQYRIGLTLDAARLDREIAQEDVRRERQRLAAEVRTTYYQISATEAGIVALRDVVRAVEELETITTRYHDEGMVLRSDFLEVKARLARERQRLSASESGLQTQREHLNQLLARDVRTPFRVATPSELASPAAKLSLEAARARARSARAEVRAAALRTAQASTARKIALSGWIPDVSLVGTYTRLVNFDSLPARGATVGIWFTWEPFDWGRKKHEALERVRSTERASEARSETEQQILVEVGQRWRAVQDAATLLEATRLEAEASAASLETDQSRYKENAAILRDVLRTEARLSGARHDYTDALAGYWSAAAELERTIGDEN